MIIKPDGVQKKLIGEVLRRVESAGLQIKSLRLLQLDRATASRFYSVHKERPFFNSLVEYMTSGPVVVVALEAPNGVTKLRTLIGATDPDKADEGTIRRLYAESIEQNVVHGSDSPENGAIETSFFFNTNEMSLSNSLQE